MPETSLGHRRLHDRTKACDSSKRTEIDYAESSCGSKYSCRRPCNGSAFRTSQDPGCSDERTGLNVQLPVKRPGASPLKTRLVTNPSVAMDQVASRLNLKHRDGSPFLVLSPDRTDERRHEVVPQFPPASPQIGPSFAFHIAADERHFHEVCRL